jgi:hypothetical protein
MENETGGEERLLSGVSPLLRGKVDFMKAWLILPPVQHRL